MAQTLETIRNSIITSIFGRRLGLDNNSFLSGPKDIKHVVTDLTSASTATAIPNHGVTNVTATSLATSAAGGVFAIDYPQPGVVTTICNVNANTSAGSPGSTAMTFVRRDTTFNIVSSEYSTGVAINLATGCAIQLTGLSTALYQVTARGTLAGSIITATT